MIDDLRLFVSDIDGTLVRSDKSLSAEVVAAARRLTAAGVSMTLISARPPSGMLWIARELGLSMPLGAFNGGTIVRPDGTILSAERLAPDISRQALPLIDRPGVVKWLFADGVWYTEHLLNDRHDASERKAANMEPIVRTDFTGLGAIDKIVAVSDDHALLADLEPVVAAALGPHAAVSRSQPYYLDITAPRANKGDGLSALAEAAGVPLDRIAVIGDQRNDLAMFARAGLSIAMGQAPEQVRSAATRVTGSNDQDGVAQAIDRILLPSLPRAV